MAALVLVAFSFSTYAGPSTTEIDVKTSTVGWEGKKVTGKHNGHIKIKEGSLVIGKLFLDPRRK